MNRRHVVERRRRPGRHFRDHAEARREQRSGIGVMHTLMEDGVFQPDDAPWTPLEFGTVRFVRFEMMRLEMAVNESVRMASAGLVRMQRGKRRTEDEERRDYEPRRHASNRTKHGIIMAAGDKPVKHGSAEDFAFRMPTRSALGSPDEKSGPSGPRVEHVPVSRGIDTISG